MPVTSVPSSRTLPAVGCSKPATSRRVVVFPQPEGPSREKNSPLCTVKSIPSTATSVKRLVSATSWTCPPATGYLPAWRRSAPVRPVLRCPGEPELFRGEPHSQLECLELVDGRVAQRALYRQPVQQRGEQHREVRRVHRAELTGFLALDHQRGDG